MYDHQGHVSPITCITFASGEGCVSSASSSGDILIHNFGTDQSISTLRSQDAQACRDLQYSPTKKHILASAGDDGNVHMYDTTATTLLFTFPRAHAAPISSLRFSATNHNLTCTAALDKKIAFYDVNKKR